MILDFRKPKKINSTEDHNRMYSSDSGINGTYIPNMSKEDMNQWKAKYITGDDRRIEIRKTIGSQLLIIVRDSHVKDKPLVRMSMNGPIEMSASEYTELTDAIADARMILAFSPDFAKDYIREQMEKAENPQKE